MVLPQVLLSWAPHLAQAVLLVEPTQHAAQMLVESFVHFAGWDRRKIHLRTGADGIDQFQNYTQVSIVTFGILWK